MKTLSPDEQVTHWDTCWMEHDICALAKIARLTERVDRLAEAVALLNSMVLAGEDHTDRSREAVRRALA